MEYCYSGTENLWYGSWNRHVCRKGKCAADRHPRSTGINPSWKQRWAFTFLMEDIYVQFEGMVYQQIVGIPMGTNCAPLIMDLVLFCYERDFMSYFHKSKWYDPLDMFNDTSRYLDDIFTIDNIEFEKHIPDIYSTELQLNKVNTSGKETSFLDLNIKGILWCSCQRLRQTRWLRISYRQFPLVEWWCS